jgi:hypothetical protein
MSWLGSVVLLLTVARALAIDDVGISDTVALFDNV